MRKATIKPEMMMKVWKLHTNSVDDRLIAETLGISYPSALRIIKIMTAAQNGEDVDAIDGNSHKKQKAFAKEFFGIEEKKEEVKLEEQEEQQNSADDITKDFMQRVLLALAWQNELLERLLDSLGVEWQKSCGKVERR
jgi:uncharacterized protein YjcR